MGDVATERLIQEGTALVWFVAAMVALILGAVNFAAFR